MISSLLLTFALIPQPTPQYGQVVVISFMGLITGNFVWIAPVGQTDKHCPHVVHVDSIRGLSINVPILDFVLFPKKSIAPMNWCPSWHAWTHLAHKIQESIDILNTGLLSSIGSLFLLFHFGLDIPWYFAASKSSLLDLFLVWDLTIDKVSSITPFLIFIKSGVLV